MSIVVAGFDIHRSVAWMRWRQAAGSASSPSRARRTFAGRLTSPRGRPAGKLARRAYHTLRELGEEAIASAP